jgi:hypothetical protein
VAKRLQQAGLIAYNRGIVRIADRDGLLDTSCECYAAINAHIYRLSGWSPLKV